MTELRMRVYGALVNRVPEIREKYHNVRDGQTDSRERLRAWAYLLFLNAVWALRLAGVFGLAGGFRGRKGPDCRTAARLPDGPESTLSLRESPQELADRLEPFDVVSFDVFDTLLLRPVCRPEDLFYLVGERLGYPDFKNLRMRAEEAARKECERLEGHRETDLFRIYGWLEREAGICAEEGMRAEERAEEELCFANPYLLETFRILKERGKRIIALSDMYLSEKQIRRMLEKCGFAGLEGCLVSCGQRCSKSDGGLYEAAKRLFGPDRSFVHIGDNPVSDGENAKRAGWSSVRYQNVNESGKAYRAVEMSPVAGSIYRGLVNAWLHNGLTCYDKDYEYGFVYGGIFALGYCQFIHACAKARGTEKILFLSRDGDILKQVYDRLYPQEAKAGRTRYALWSRLAAAKLSAGFYRQDYFRRFLFHKVNQGYTLREIFSTMELEDLLDGIEDPRAQLTDKNAGVVKDYLCGRWEEVLAHYEKQNEEAKAYYEEALSGCRTAAAVDIGWAGSGALALDYLVNRIWKLGCDITGIVAGTNTPHNAEPDMSEAQLASGKLISYAFSSAHNRDLWERHDPAKGDNVVMERLLSSPLPGFRGFAGEDYEAKALAPRADEEARRAARIQAGVLDYCSLYQSSRIPEYAGAISGRDAAAPAFLWMAGKKKLPEGTDIQCVLT